MCGCLGKDTRQDDAAGDQPAVELVKLTQRRVARVGCINWHRESMVMVKQARAVKPRTEVRYHENGQNHTCH